MFVAHLPAGYLFARRFAAGRAALIAGLAGSVFPDADMLWFYLVDQQQHLHHSYWTHLPVFWLAVAFAAELILAHPNHARARSVVRLFVGGALLHLCLDTVVGGIRWLMPLSAHEFALFEVQSRYRWWVWNFVIHWTFLFELLLIAIAARTLARRRRRSLTLPRSDTDGAVAGGAAVSAYGGPDESRQTRRRRSGYAGERRYRHHTTGPHRF